VRSSYICCDFDVSKLEWRIEDVKLSRRTCESRLVQPSPQKAKMVAEGRVGRE
jgi:hypothetical protein